MSCQELAYMYSYKAYVGNDLKAYTDDGVSRGNFEFSFRICGSKAYRPRVMEKGRIGRDQTLRPNTGINVRETNVRLLAAVNYVIFFIDNAGQTPREPAQVVNLGMFRFAKLRSIALLDPALIEYHNELECQ